MCEEGEEEGEGEKLVEEVLEKVLGVIDVFCSVVKFYWRKDELDKVIELFKKVLEYILNNVYLYC